MRSGVAESSRSPRPRHVLASLLSLQPVEGLESLITIGYSLDVSKGTRRRAFGSTLRAWRERLGLTQAEAAELLGVHAVTLARWEVGMRTPYAIVAKAIEDRIAQDTRKGKRA